MLASYILCFVTCFIVLFYFQRLNFAPEIIRQEGPKSHYGKSGTPTMAGICFILMGLFWMLFMCQDQWPFCLCIFGYMLIGTYDDWVKITGVRRGLSMRVKMLLLLLTASIVMFFVPVVPIQIPFLGTEFIMQKGWYMAFGALVLTSSANAMNFTDGVDGLCATQFLVLLLGLFIFQLLDIVQMPSLLMMSAYVGIGVLAFLYYNAQPAQMFMGDSGSLPLGALIGFLYMQSGLALYLPWLALVLVAEVLSVMIQIFSFKRWGKRVFKMAPLHHHFELSHWSNMQIVIRFLIVTVLTHCVFILGGL